MKVFFIIALLLIGIFIVFQIYITMSTNKTETQPYKVIRTEANFEIRYYPAATMAMIASTSKSFRDLGNSGFGKHFRREPGKGANCHDIAGAYGDYRLYLYHGFCASGSLKPAQHSKTE
jgi:hypothetical protein